MLNESKATFGVFFKDSEVATARGKLKAKGFLNSNISILYPNKKIQDDFQRGQKSMILPYSKKGALFGSILFGFLGLLIVTNVVSVTAVPLGFSSLDKVLVILFSITLGVIFGVSSGALVGIGTPQVASKRFAHYIKSGGILMSVPVKNAEEERWAHTAFKNSGAQDITILEQGQGWEEVYKNRVPETRNF